MLLCLLTEYLLRWDCQLSIIAAAQIPARKITIIRSLEKYRKCIWLMDPILDAASINRLKIL